MPENKDFKRLVRARMRKTGESYTAARAQLLAQRPPAEGSAPLASPPGASTTPPGSSPGHRATPATLPADHERVAGMSDRAVRDATGLDWAEWAKWLDDLSAATLPHRRIAELVADRDGVSLWWAQMVTVAYERFRGLRDVGQRRGGSYEISKSKTVNVPVSRLYQAFEDPKIRASWLGDLPITVRTATAGKSMRIRLPDDSPLDVYFGDKGEARSSVTVQHRDLPDKPTAERMRRVWGERLARLAEVLTPS